MSHQVFLLLFVPRLLKQDCIALTWSAYPLKRQVSCHPFLIDILLKSRKLLIRVCIFLDIKDAEGSQRVNRVTVFERPGLHEFLQRTSEFADLILFTAGLEGLLPE
jgi:hypothetical protein